MVANEIIASIPAALAEKVCTARFWRDHLIPKWNYAPVALYMGYQLVPECPPPTFLSVA
jgi:hypothetical protein